MVPRLAVLINRAQLCFCGFSFEALKCVFYLLIFSSNSSVLIEQKSEQMHFFLEQDA